MCDANTKPNFISSISTNSIEFVAVMCFSIKLVHHRAFEQSLYSIFNSCSRSWCLLFGVIVVVMTNRWSVLNNIYIFFYQLNLSYSTWKPPSAINVVHAKKTQCFHSLRRKLYFECIFCGSSVVSHYGWLTFSLFHFVGPGQENSRWVGKKYAQLEVFARWTTSHADFRHGWYAFFFVRDSRSHAPYDISIKHANRTAYHIYVVGAGC